MMFRRFMIVCWVLFSLSALVSLVGWTASEYYDARVHSYAEQHDLNPDPRKWEPTDLLEELAKEREMGEPTPRQELGRLRDIRRGLQELIWIGIVPAAALLLWNIFCHTAHWIWEGRKERQ